MFCEDCGTKISDDARFCYKCGKPVRNEIVNENAETPSQSTSMIEEPLTEENSVRVVCSECGYSGPMKIIERNNLTFWKKAMIYTVGYGTIICVGYVLDLLLAKSLPWLLLFIFGLIAFAICSALIKVYVTASSISKVYCPQCKQVLNYIPKWIKHK